MKTEDTETLGRQRAKPSKIKARYSRPAAGELLLPEHKGSGNDTRSDI